MSTLIIFLPLGAPGATTSYDYAITPDGRSLADHASVTLALLPAPAKGGDVVAVVPASLLSWHAVELPKGVGPGSPRVRLVLENLLEDRLLDDPANLHLALASGASAAGPAWVAVCDKAWLRGHLQALEAAQRPITRVVPEFAPEVGPLHVHAVGDADLPQLVVTGLVVGGVLRLPLSAAAVALIPSGELDDAAVTFAEPAVAELAEQLLERKVTLLTRSERWLDATRSPWDLAQFDMANSGRARTVKRLSGVFSELLQAPGWRPARWGVAVLLGAQLLGLNAWAWKEQSAFQARRAATQGLLTQTFPQVKLVVDAPLQMEREVAALRQATGATSGRDLEAMLAALGTAAPADRSAGAIDFLAGEVKIKGLQLSAQEASSLSAQLKSQGYAARQEGDALIVKQDAASNSNSSNKPDGAP
jgi:general secretion pathway protein L